MTLTEFLLARIKEDETEVGVLVGRDEGAGPNGMGWAEVGAISEVLMISHARALAECESKRRIIAAIVEGCECDASGMDGGCQVSNETLKALAMPYATHPDYRPEWSA